MVERLGSTPRRVRRHRPIEEPYPDILKKQPVQKVEFRPSGKLMADGQQGGMWAPITVPDPETDPNFDKHQISPEWQALFDFFDIEPDLMAIIEVAYALLERHVPAFGPPKLDVKSPGRKRIDPNRDISVYRAVEAISLGRSRMVANACAALASEKSGPFEGLKFDTLRKAYYRGKEFVEIINAHQPPPLTT